MWCKDQKLLLIYPGVPIRRLLYKCQHFYKAHQSKHYVQFGKALLKYFVLGQQVKPQMD